MLHHLSHRRAAALARRSGLLLLIGFIATSARAGEAPPAIATAAPDAIALQVAEETATLEIRPKTIETTRDKARVAADALRSGDYKTGASIAQQVLKASHLQTFGFAPFNRFIPGLSDGDEPAYLAGVNLWISKEPRSALAYLLRASYEFDTAWAIRGTDFAQKVTQEHWRGFHDNLALAEADVLKSIKLDAHNPWAYFLWVKVVANRVERRDESKLDEAFRAAISRYPTYYEIYSTRLYFLEPKWHGSEQAMYDFVAEYADKAPAGSPLKLLYLQLAANLLNAGSTGCDGLKHERLNECVESYMNAHVTRVLTDGVSQAFALYRHADAVQVNTAVWPILGNLESARGESTAINSILTVAAEAAGSENTLIHEPGHNNYVLDDITARIWTHLDNPANVDQKFREALDDVEHTRFANEEDRVVARAAIYDHMAHAARNASQWVRVIAYHDAANAVAGPDHGGNRYYACFAYYKLNRFQRAVDECSRLLDAHQDVFLARYYRARAYEGLKRYDAAVADFQPLAANGSDNYLRWGAAIEMEHVMAMQGRYQEVLDFLLANPYLFDANLQPPDDLAIAYNNRCFAYMKTGQPEKALDDCNASLRYGKLPDALQKQQQLMKLLNRPASTAQARP